ncbi:MAG: M23 family metallopeptidase [Alkalispirochaeta sp.]
MKTYSWWSSIFGGRKNRLPKGGAHRWVLAGVLAVTAVWPGVALPATAVDVPPTVLQGEVLPVTISSAPATGAPMTGATVALTLSDGSRYRAPAWRAAAHGSSDRTLWVALLGVPSTAAIGDAQVVVQFSGADRATGEAREDQTLPVQIGEGRFRSERIALNRDLTDLRTTDDPRRAEQSQTLWELIHRMDIESRGHLGRFRLPVRDFRETSLFGDRREFSYADGGSARSIHNGLDLAAPTGTPVVAPGAGRVVMAEDRIITGLSVILEHLPGVYTIYYHLDSMEVSLGDTVATGSPLGTVGSTGLSTGPHLHWELRVAGVAVDPQVYLTEALIDTAAIVRSLSQLP